MLERQVASTEVAARRVASIVVEAEKEADIAAQVVREVSTLVLGQVVDTVAEAVWVASMSRISVRRQRRRNQ